MLSEQQRAWLNKLSDTKLVEIIPYNPRVKQVFARQRSEIQRYIGSETEILHKGASAWGISGKGDVDIYVPVPEISFESYFKNLKRGLGEPGSYYHLERVRWNREDEDIEIEIFLTNKDSAFWTESLLFWNYIESHPDVLDEYRKIKEEAHGLSIREYYTRKTVFINKVLLAIK